MIDYSKFLNNSIQEIKPSGIRKFFDIASEMDDVISLSIGEPDFQTPWHIREEGINSLKNGKTWYSPNRVSHSLEKKLPIIMQDALIYHMRAKLRCLLQLAA